MDTPKLAPEIHSWDRQPGESEDQWITFKAYREMTRPRRLHKSGFLGGLPVATATLSGWYRTNKWDERVTAYDNHLEDIFLKHKEAILQEQAEDVKARHLAVLHDMIELASLETQKHLTISKKSDGPATKAADLGRLLEAAIKLDRLVRGDTTENTGHEVDLSGMSLEELRIWNERLTELKAKP